MCTTSDCTIRIANLSFGFPLGTGVARLFEMGGHWGGGNVLSERHTKMKELASLEA